MLETHPFVLSSATIPLTSHWRRNFRDALRGAQGHSWCTSKGTKPLFYFIPSDPRAIFAFFVYSLFTLITVRFISGIILCLGALLGGCIYVRRRRIQALSAIDESSDSTLTVTPLHQHGEHLRPFDQVGPWPSDSESFVTTEIETQNQNRQR